MTRNGVLHLYRLVLEGRPGGQGDRALGVDARAVEARLVDAAPFLADVGIHRPFDRARRQPHGAGFAALIALLERLAVHGVALDLGPVALVLQHDVRAGDGLPLAPAFGNAGDGLVAARLPRGHEVADHVHRQQEEDRERRDRDQPHQQGPVHTAQLLRRRGRRRG